MKLRAAILTMALAAMPMFASAEEYPSRPVTVIVPFAAGGQTDSVARIMGERLQVALKQPFVVENRTGAGGVVGTQLAASAAPDGYTIVIVGPSTMITQPLLNPEVQYDVEGDFRPLARVASAPMVFVVNSDSPFSSLGELVDHLRTDQLSFGSSGHGSSMHLSTEWFKNIMGVDALHIPFRGSSQSLLALMGGEIDFLIDPPITAQPLIEDGKLRALAVTARTGDERLADIPTMQEAGVEGFEQLIWNGFMVPAGTPDEVVARLEAAFRDILADDEVKNRLAGLGLEADFRTGEEFTALLREERETYGRIIAEAGITLE